MRIFKFKCSHIHVFRHLDQKICSQKYTLTKRSAMQLSMNSAATSISSIKFFKFNCLSLLACKSEPLPRDNYKIRFYKIRKSTQRNCWILTVLHNTVSTTGIWSTNTHFESRKANHN